MNSIERGCFLIADVSGYTRYLGGVELDHAQDILADLLGAVVTNTSVMRTAKRDNAADAPAATGACRAFLPMCASGCRPKKFSPTSP